MPPSWQTLSLCLLAPAYVAAGVFNCDKEVVNDHTFIASPLKGTFEVHHFEYAEPSVLNTTYTINICDPLKPIDGIDTSKQCHQGTRICAQTYSNNTGELEEIRSIAGQYTDVNRHMDAKVKWMAGGGGHDDVGKKGFRVTMNGGRYPFSGREFTPQQAIIEFICDENLTGLEGLTEDAVEKRDEEETSPEFPDVDNGKSLQFVSDRLEEDEGGNKVKVLRLTWRTKHACDDSTVSDPPKSSTGGWGWFTWFVIIVFLLAAAYIIFGSWLNYNRYGARGWDLIPHGDTIRDLPYIIKDLASNLMGRIRGDGSRGGYSAV